MSKHPLPDDLRRFVLMAIPSVPYLEAVLLMRREPGVRWDAATLARRLYVQEPEAAELLQALQQAGVAAPAQPGPGPVLYRPAHAELAELLDRLAAAYTTNLVGVTDLIHSRIDRRAQRFADAFRWRKEN